MACGWSIDSAEVAGDTPYPIKFTGQSARRGDGQQQGTNASPTPTVSLKTPAMMLDAHRSSVRRWLTDAGIRPVVVGRGRNAALRYRWQDIERWLETREEID